MFDITIIGGWHQTLDNPDREKRAFLRGKLRMLSNVDPSMVEKQ